MPGELLDRLRRRSAHRQMRAERVAKNVRVAGDGKPGAPLRLFDPVAKHVSGHRRPVVERQDTLAAKMPVPRQRLGQRVGHRNDRIRSMNRVLGRVTVPGGYFCRVRHRVA